MQKASVASATSMYACTARSASLARLRAAPPISVSIACSTVRWASLTADEIGERNARGGIERYGLGLHSERRAFALTHRVERGTRDVRAVAVLKRLWQARARNALAW